jgi:hypothetical protein
MDQTILKNQALLWHLAQQRQDSNLHCRGYLRAYCHHQKETESLRMSNVGEVRQVFKEQEGL